MSSELGDGLLPGAEGEDEASVHLRVVVCMGDNVRLAETASEVETVAPQGNEVAQCSFVG